MLSRSRPLVVAVTSLLAAVLVASPAEAVKKRPLIALGKPKVVKPFKGGKAPTPRPLAGIASLNPHGGFIGARQPAHGFPEPEIGGAVGTTQVVQADAANLTVFSRTGPQQKQTAIDDLCIGDVTDPRVLYDRHLGRWFIVMISEQGPPQAICIMTSKTASASGAYNVVGYQLPDAGGRTRNLRIGMDLDALFIVFDQFDAEGTYSRTGAFALSKPLLVSNQPGFPPFYDGLPAVTPPVVVDGRRSSSYFLAAGASGNKLRLFTATNMHRGGPWEEKPEVTVPPFANALEAEMPATSATILVGDANFQGSSYQALDRLVNAHTINRNGHPTVRWYDINIDDSTLKRSGRLFESGTSDDFSPTVAATEEAAFFTWTSTDARHATTASRHNPRMRFAVWEQGDPVNKVGAAAITGDQYAPVPDGEGQWGRSQVTLSPTGFGSCPRGTQAFAVGPYAADKELWRGYVKKFGTC